MLRLSVRPERCSFVRVGAVVLRHFAANQTFARLIAVRLLEIGVERHRVRFGRSFEGCVGM